ncbi:MAG TPA: phosphate acyltransferase PlsX [Chroococcales cyanobacterium]|jgi:glycerol-3-phosphate acyltransferase PlsX
MKTIRIALDAMGGDHGPREILRGAWETLADYPDLEILLVGDSGQLEGCAHPRLKRIHAPEAVSMEEAPARAILRKRTSSMVVAIEHVKEGLADAVISTGNTGAFMSAALLILGRIPSIERPAITAVLPSRKGPCILLDVGANADCKPSYLRQFAVMGAVYARKVLKVDNPRVGLLNIGGEEGKGNELAQAAFALLKETPNLDFRGNVEGRELLEGTFDVVVTDGFVGNIALKSLEGCALFCGEVLHEEIKRSGLRGMLGYAFLNRCLKACVRRLDYTEYGGAPLLGINGICIVAHGSSKAPAIRHAVRVAYEAVKSQAIERVSEEIRLLAS